MTETTWEADKMLDVYIHDYFIKRDLKSSAQAFKVEGKVSSDPVAIDAPGGFLLEWWSVFWDIFIARTSEKASDAAVSYIETQLMKAREQQRPQQQQLQQPQHSQHHQQMQVQQLMLQRQAQQQQQHQQQHQHPQHAQQQQQGGSHLLNGPGNGIGENDSLAKQNNGVSSALASKMSDQKLNLPLQRDSMDDAVMKQRLGSNASPLLDSNHAAILKSAVATSQPSGSVSPATAGGMAPHVQPRSQQFPGSTPDIKSEINPILNARAAGLEGSLIGVPGSHNQGGNNLTLKGLPLMGLDQLRSGILQQPKSMMPGHQPLHQLQMLTPHHQQQLMLAQQNLTSPQGNDLDSRRLRMLLNNQSMPMVKDGLPNPVDNIVPNIGSPMQPGGPVLSRADPDLLMKLKMAQQLQQQKQSQGSGQSQQQQQQIQQLILSGQQPQSSNQILQQDKIMGGGHVTGDGSMSNSFHGNDQSAKNQNGRKRRNTTPTSGPGNSAGTPNTAGPSPSSAPSTPSTHTAGDVISMPSMQHGASSSKPVVAFGADSSGTLKSPSNQLWDEKKYATTEMDHLMDDVEDNVESFLSQDDADIRDDVGRGMDISKEFSFNEVRSVCASASKVVCCHFSSDGKLLASGDHDKKVILWYTDSLKPKYTLEEHSSFITDVRFSPSMARLATSSFDKTVRVWDADNPTYSIRTFTGHSASVMSLDFHPNKEDIICSCDDNGEIRYWSINHGSYTKVFKGGTTQVRFQPRTGRYLAAASDNVVSILDAETQVIRYSLKGHASTVNSICWDLTGEFLASVSDDSVRVWTFRPGSNEGTCLHELNCNGNKFYSCVFHPSFPSSLLIIGCYQSLELWDMAEKAKMTVATAHERLIASLAVSSAEGLVASASHDRMVKLWK